MKKIDWEKVRQAVTLLHGVPKITFRSSAGGLYTCNQTGQKVTKKGIQSYVFQIWNFIHPRPARHKEQAEAVAILHGAQTEWPYYICPHEDCNATHTEHKWDIRTRPFYKKCKHCNKTFKVINSAE